MITRKKYPRKAPSLATHLVVPVVLAVLFMIVSERLKSAHNEAHVDIQAECLALNMYHEAAGEPVAGQIAVAYVTLNRSSSRYMTVCDTVYTDGAFSWTGRGKTVKYLKDYYDILDIAKEVLDTYPKLDITEGATYYHNPELAPNPCWKEDHEFILSIGNHDFYRDVGVRSGNCSK